VTAGINSSILQLIACISPTVPHTDPSTPATSTDSPPLSEQPHALHLLGKVTRKAVVTPLIETTPLALKKTVKYPASASSSSLLASSRANEEEIVEEAEEFGYGEGDL
jgi:hypothetical protein